MARATRAEIEQQAKNWKRLETRMWLEEFRQGNFFSCGRCIYSSHDKEINITCGVTCNHPVIECFPGSRELPARALGLKFKRSYTLYQEWPEDFTPYGVLQCDGFEQLPTPEIDWEKWRFHVPALPGEEEDAQKP
jgi:hypothetical protein